jgi:hypothetical protein
MTQSWGESLLTAFKNWLPVVTVVGGGLWGLFTYIDHQKEVERESRLQAASAQASRNFDARRPFLEKQFGLYVETSKVVGYLVAHQPTHKDWDENQARFNELYWSELAMVESKEVEAAMVKMGHALSDYMKSSERADTQLAASGAAYELSHAIRKDIESIWQGR